MNREVSIRVAHPRLRVPRAEVAHLIALLDERFEMLPGDLAALSVSRSRRSALKKNGGNSKSKILGVCPPGELSLVFLTDQALAQIHSEFMNDPSATDVITFEGNASAGLAGEICVSADTAARYVGNLGRSSTRRRQNHRTQRRNKERKAFRDAFAIELTLYLIHGWLHLAGYDDLSPAKKRRMRAAEARSMKMLLAAKAVPDFRLT